ncbi:MAG TPA: SBBP repeat-containing protein [Anaerolineales bacterium]|nr:SBBP repeat-containing protein [Anaerolineales bacterium]
MKFLSKIRHALLMGLFALSLCLPASMGASAQPAAAPEDAPFTWNTFLGASNGDDWGTRMAVDASGNIFVMGASMAGWGCFPLNCTVRPASYYDVFVAKLDSGGMLQWTTFLGGDGVDMPGNITLDDSGNIYVGGSSEHPWSCSPTPCTGHAFTPGGGSMSFETDGFAAKLDPNGVLLWNSFMGGDSQDMGGGVAVDGAGNVYAAGYGFKPWSCSPASCTVHAFTAGYGDAFAARLDPSTGALVWNTFWGSSGGDEAVAADFDGGSLYILGGSGYSWGTPVRPFGGSSDAFVAKVDPSTGALQWHTFLGGGSWYTDEAAFDVVDGNSYVVGNSGATWGNPVRAFTPPSGTCQCAPDGFVAKVDPNGGLVWNTFLGADGDDDGNGIAVKDGSVYAVGYSNVSWGTPVRAFTPTSRGYGDAFAAKLGASDGALHWNSFLGAAGEDLGYGAAVDSGGNLLATGRTESTWGTPINPFGGPYDEIFVADLPSVVADSTAPVVESFTVPSIAYGLSTNISAFTASDNLGVTGYKITESSTPPLPDDAGWTASVPQSYAVAALGTYVLYPWTKDATGNVSAVFASPASVTFTLPLTATLKSIGTQDGWLLESGENTNKGGTKDNALTTLRLGDDKARKQYLSIVSFNTGAALPDAAVITSLKLKVRKQAIVGGGNPVTAFQGFMLDVKKGTLGASALELNDFQMTAASGYKTFGPFKPAADSGGWYTITLPAAAISYINKASASSGLTQIRLRFQQDDNNNAAANYLSLFSGNATAASQPQLIVQYHMP